MSATLYKILEDLSLPYQVDRYPPDNIYIQCYSEKCITKGEFRKPTLGIKVSQGGSSAKQGAFHCWVCEQKGSNILNAKTLQKVLGDPLNVDIKDAFGALLADSKEAEKLATQTIQPFIDTAFSVDENVVMEGLADGEYRMDAHHLFGYVNTKDGDFVIKKIGALERVAVPVTQRYTQYMINTDGGVFDDVAEKYRPENIERTSSVADALKRNIERKSDNYIAVHVETDSPADAICTKIEESNIRFNLQEYANTLEWGHTDVADDARKFLSDIDPDFDYFDCTDQYVIFQILNMLTKGIVHENDTIRVGKFLDDITMEDKEPLHVLVVGQDIYIDKLLKHSSTANLLVGEAQRHVHLYVCDNEYAVSMKKGGMYVKGTQIDPQDIKKFQDKIESLMPNNLLILAVGDGFNLVNAVLDEQVNLDLSNKLRKSLFEMSGWLHKVKINGIKHRLFVLASEPVKSIAHNSWGKENFLVSATNNVFTVKFKSRTFVCLRFYLRHMTKFAKCLIDYECCEETSFHGVKCHYTLSGESIKEMLDFAKGRVLGVDIETTGLLPYREEANFKLISIAFSDGITTHSVWLADQENVEPFLFHMFRLCKKAVFHNAEFDLKVMMWLYETVKEYINVNYMKFEDTLGIANIFRIRADMSKRAEVGPISLDNLTKTVFGFYLKQSLVHVDRTRMWKYLDAGDDLKKVVLIYNGGDSKTTSQLYKTMWLATGSTGNATDVYHWYKHQMGVVIACCNIVNNGMPVSIEKMIEIGNELHDTIQKDYDSIQNHDLVKLFKSSIYGEGVEEFNPKSDSVKTKFAVHFLGLTDPDKKMVAAHDKSKAGYWAYACSRGEGNFPDQGRELFDLIVAHGQNSSLLNTNIRPYRNVLLYEARRDPTILHRVKFLDWEQVDLNKLSEHVDDSDDGGGDFDDLDELYDDSQFAFSSEGKADYFLRTTSDGNGTVYIHANLKVFGSTVSGRIASSPNIQNITPDIRAMYVAPEGHTFVAVDCGGADVTMAAYIYMAVKLLDFLWEGRDIHKELLEGLIATTRGTSCDIIQRYFKLHPDVTEESALRKKMRTMIKSNVTFATIYGSKDSQMQETLGLTDELFAEYKMKYIDPLLGDIKKGHQLLINEYKTQGFHKRKIINVPLYGDFTVNQIFNIPVQGGTAKWANLSLIQQINAGIRLVNIVHDESISLTPLEEQESTCKVMMYEMCTSVLRAYPTLGDIVPLSVEGCASPSWKLLKTSPIATDTSTNYGYTRKIYSRPKDY